LQEEGYSAVFLGNGAGLPIFMNIPGETLNGVYSANEYLTRINLMKAYQPDSQTPIRRAKQVLVVGGGNVAMDAARSALRMGAHVTVLYRRSMEELPARAEEVHHAQEEGVEFSVLKSPVAILGDENGWVTGARCVRMELGQPDASGRRSPVEVEGSEFDLPADMVIMALGTRPNPLLTQSMPELTLNRAGCIEVDDDTMMTNLPGVFAGGDSVSGAATVILAMGAGKKAARGIDDYIQGLEA
jgi:glutamate synthase (NADPH/NADH) small chain